MPTRSKGQGPRKRPAAPAAKPEAKPAEAKREHAAAPAAGGSQIKRLPARNPRFPLGVSYYPLDDESQDSSEWYDRDVEPDFKLMQGAHLSLVRIFVSWKLFEPQVGQYNEDALERLSEIVASAREHKMRAVIVFFADDRHADLVDVTWSQRRDVRKDPYLLQRQVALVQRVVNRLRTDPGVFAWDLANEAFCSGFESAEDLAAWCSTMRDAVREVDPDRPITLSIDPETLFRHSGVDAREAIATCEFGVSHLTAAYRAYAAEGPITSGPATYLEGFLLRSALRSAPVLLDDIGPLTLDASHAEEAAYVRTVLWSALMNRGSGALLRRWRDMATDKREPYFVDPFETLVGVVDSDGEAKPSLAEVRSFGRVVSNIDLDAYSPQAERTAIIVPAERYATLPALAGLYGPRACLQGYIFAKQAHVPVAVAAETDDLDRWSVLIVPSPFDLAEESWERLAAFVQSGGSLVLSYGGGDPPPVLRDLFGVEFLGDGGSRSRFECRVAHDDLLGSLESFDAPLAVPNFAMLGHGNATVVATDAKGSPLLTVNQYGQGRAIFMAVPIERAVAQGDAWAVPEKVAAFVRTVYGAAARAAGCGSPFACDMPGVEIAHFAGDDGDLLLLLNHSADKVVAQMTLDRRVASIADVRGGAPVAVGAPAFGVPLGANGAVALRLSYG